MGICSFYVKWLICMQHIRMSRCWFLIISCVWGIYFLVHVRVFLLENFFFFFFKALLAIAAAGYTFSKCSWLDFRKYQVQSMGHLCLCSMYPHMAWEPCTDSLTTVRHDSSFESLELSPKIICKRFYLRLLETQFVSLTP